MKNESAKILYYVAWDTSENYTNYPKWNVIKLVRNSATFYSILRLKEGAYTFVFDNKTVRAFLVEFLLNSKNFKRLHFQANETSVVLV